MNGGTRQLPRTLGPVPDLERHLPSEWWQDLFDSLYLKTDGDVVENECNTQHDVDLIENLLKPGQDSRIFDLCCGQGRHTLELARRGYAQVTGLDRSRYLVRLARTRAKNTGLKAHFMEGDARKAIRVKQSFDHVVIMGNSFGYFEQSEDDLEVLLNVHSYLAPGGSLLMDITDGGWMREHFEKRSWEWIDQNHFVCRERSLSQDRTRLISREVITHADKGVLVDQFYAERLYTMEEMRKLLAKAGFTDITHHGQAVSNSTRGHDLGMMENRLIITAKKPSITPQVSAPVFKSVAVLLGDPRLGDTVKLNGQFNPEDMQTIEKMKQALGSVGQFEYTWVDDHQSLMRNLMEGTKPDFVFNLCDEGYRNNAFHELHVPALLEMLDIPYTGAGPACLGLCYNKELIRGIAKSLEIPVPEETYTGPYEKLATLPGTFPVLVKPNFGDSSIGITKNAVINNQEELFDYLHWLRREFGRIGVLIQEFLAKEEYSVGVIGNPGLTYRVLPPLEVDFSGLPDDLPPILGYESKWDPESPYWKLVRYKPAELDLESRRQLLDYSNLLFERLGCRDYARFDFRRDCEGVIKLMEVNPNPGWCWDGKLNIMAGFEGLSYGQLLEMILNAGMERIAASA